jgi:hypothetical protein
MRKWGTVVTAAYALILVGLLVPFALHLADKNSRFADFNLADLLDSYRLLFEKWILWIPLGIVLVSEALLLFLTVDTSFRRFKPRAHILVSCLVTATLWALLTGAAIFSLGYGIYGDNFPDFFERRVFADPALQHSASVHMLLCWAALWIVWAVVFYLYFRGANAQMTRAISWLIKGSVLELLIAVPSHIAVRRRNQCSAPIVTSFGIATGIAMMLLSFGPSVLLLYKKRLDGYATRRPDRTRSLDS